MLFCAALLEALPVLGSLIPGSSVILGLSALIAAGRLDVFGVLAAVIAGAALGDGTAYWVGHRHHDVFRRLWPLSRHPELVARSEGFFREHGGKAVFLARFLPPVRAIVPITAGVLEVPPRRFFALNLCAILLWAPAHVLPGALAGGLYERVGAVPDRLLLPVGAGIVAVVLVAWAIRRHLRREAHP